MFSRLQPRMQGLFDYVPRGLEQPPTTTTTGPGIKPRMQGLFDYVPRGLEQPPTTTTTGPGANYNYTTTTTVAGCGVSDLIEYSPRDLETPPTITTCPATNNCSTTTTTAACSVRSCTTAGATAGIGTNSYINTAGVGCAHNVNTSWGQSSQPMEDQNQKTFCDKSIPTCSESTSDGETNGNSSSAKKLSSVASAVAKDPCQGKRPAGKDQGQRKRPAGQDVAWMNKNGKRMCPYNRYVQERMKGLKGKMHREAYDVCMKIIGTRWKEMNEDEKAKYDTSSEEEKRKAAAKKIAPKRPISGYAMWLNHFSKTRKQNNCDKHAFLREASQAWRKMSCKNKKTWNEKSHATSLEYAQTMKETQNKIVRKRHALDVKDYDHEGDDGSVDEDNDDDEDDGNEKDDADSSSGQ